MKFATWNVNECVGITCDLNNQKTADIINTNKTIIDKQYTDLEKENEILRQQIEFLKKISN